MHVHVDMKRRISYVYKYIYIVFKHILTQIIARSLIGYMNYIA